MQVCQDIIERLQTEPDLLHRVITGDDSWIFEYDPETKRQSCHWTVLKKARVKIKSQSHVDHVLRCQSKFSPQGQTINLQVYKEILRLLLRSVREK